MSSTKDLNEVLKFSGASINAGKQIAKDKKLTGDDLQYIFRPATLAPDALKDASEIFKQAASVSNEDLDLAHDNFSGELNAFSPDLKYDLEKISQAIISVGRIAARGKLDGIEEGKAAGRAELLRELSSAGYSLKAFKKAGINTSVLE